ncbi:hypothetical protein OH77DRAFT_178039 [Trametes cingulata]|nr:hypothetical protein OH77DRAFT_178039 [Trametes cingulata]
MARLRVSPTRRLPRSPLALWKRTRQSGGAASPVASQSHAQKPCLGVKVPGEGRGGRTGRSVYCAHRTHPARPGLGRSGRFRLPLGWKRRARGEAWQPGGRSPVGHPALWSGRGRRVCAASAGRWTAQALEAAAEIARAQRRVRRTRSKALCMNGIGTMNSQRVRSAERCEERELLEDPESHGDRFMLAMGHISSVIEQSATRSGQWRAQRHRVHQSKAHAVRKTCGQRRDQQPGRERSQVKAQATEKSFVQQSRRPQDEDLQRAVGYHLRHHPGDCSGSASTSPSGWRQ